MMAEIQILDIARVTQVALVISLVGIFQAALTKSFILEVIRVREEFKEKNGLQIPLAESLHPLEKVVDYQIWHLQVI